ncbi:helix-turn-helix domain-containing protein [Candidatus Micrarchaeota archaeon]|nr:helix-turn-helix domain-containing protein [Candidatus Micrarchaeota archaeon]
MWIAEFKVWHTGSAAREATARFDALIETHYLNVFTQKKKELVSGVMVYYGKQAEQAMQYVIEGLKKQGATNLKREGNQMFYTVASIHQFHSIVLNANVFFIRPQQIRGGYGYWTVAAWEKKHLLGFYNALRKLPKSKATVELLSLKQGLAPVFPSSIRHALSDKQREAFELACQEGYYASPRRASLEELAEKADLPYTTFKDRLRAAESELWPKLVS